MPVDKFGRTQIGETPSTAEGVSLSYISRNFQRKGDIIDMTGNPIVNVSEPRHPQDAATKSFVLDTIGRKPLITVFAEEKGALSEGHAEWSFGNGMSAFGIYNIGYPMPAAGRIIKGSLCTVTGSGNTSDYVKVNLVKNGYEQIYNSIEKADDEWSGSVSFDPPLEVNIGDRINFVSKTSNADVTGAVVSVLIELDM